MVIIDTLKKVLKNLTNFIVMCIIISEVFLLFNFVNMATSNFKNLENLDRNSEIESQVEAELTNLWLSVKEFYEVKKETNSVEFKTDVVKNYFDKLNEDVNIKWKTSKESWQYLVSDNKRFTTCIMAMQIALESMWYEIQKIDWRLWKNTKAGIKRFQTQCGLSLKDGLPGQETISKLCEALKNPTAFEAKQEFKPSTVKASASASVSDSGGTSEKPSAGTTSGGTGNDKQPWSVVDNQSWGQKWVEKVSKFHDGRDVYTVSDLNIIPETWKWDDKNVIYEYKVPNMSNQFYQFFNWWTGYFYNGTLEDRNFIGSYITNSKPILDRLKKWNADEKDYSRDIRLLKDSISEIVKDKFVPYKNEKRGIWVDTYNGKINFYLKPWQDYKVSLSAWDLLDKEWSFDRSYFENVLLAQVKNGLARQCEAETVKGLLIWVKKKWYSMDDIFGKENNLGIKYVKYFQEMDKSTKKVTFDDISRDGENIKFSLDNDGSNKSYNKLSVKYNELVDNNGNFSEDKLKAYLKKTITDIINKNF